MITPSFHPRVGGVEVHVRRVSECLAASGHRVSVLTHADTASEESLGSLQVYRLPRTGWWAAWRGARPHIAASDVVHCHDAYSFLHFYLPSWYLPPRRPVFATFHGYESYPIPLEAKLWRRFVRGRVRNAICIGDFICRWYQTPCFAVAFGGVDALAEAPSFPPQPSALFLGRLAGDTSIMTYLEALAILKTEHERDLPLGVVGAGPLKEPAARYAEAHRLRVDFHGEVADPGRLFAGIQFAFVSGYLAIWQALALKRLVFAVYENELKRDYLLGFPEAGQVMVVTSDAAELARELARHLSDPSLGDHMRDRGARLASEHSWDRVARLYLAMYRAHGIG